LEPAAPGPELRFVALGSAAQAQVRTQAQVPPLAPERVRMQSLAQVPLLARERVRIPARVPPSASERA
jgi:hypothetical protein